MLTPRNAALILIVLACTPVPAEEPPSFREDVAPILVRKCLGCHGEKKAESGLNMKDLGSILKGGKTLPGEAIVPGDPDSSYLIELVRPGSEPRMPYKLPPLSDAEIRTLERWVAEGAKLDDGLTPETPLASLVDPLKGLPAVPPQFPTANPVAAVAYSPDGRRLAAARGKTVLLFDAGTERPAQELPDHPGPVNALAFTPDGGALIAAGGRPGQFGSIVVWDIDRAGTKRLDLRPHADTILAAALAPDGKTLATASYDRLVKVWGIATGTELRTLKEHTDAVHGVAFSPDGRLIASAAADRTVKVWDVASGRRLVSLGDATAEQYAVRFAPDGTTLLAGGVDRTIRAWKLQGETATLVRSASAHDAAVLRLVVSSDGRGLLSCGEDRLVKLWDLATLAARGSLPAADWPLDIAVHPEGGPMAVGTYDGALTLIDPALGMVVSTLLQPPAAAAIPPAQPQPASKPELVRSASLAPPSPRGGPRGTKLRVTLSGNGVGRAETVQFSEPGIVAQILEADQPDPNRLEIDLNIAPTARPGMHAFRVRTPLGTPAPQTFVVSAHPETTLAEPDDAPGEARMITLPATILGTIEKPGDLDHVRFEARAGQPVVLEVLARPLGSSMAGSLVILDAEGRILAESAPPEGGGDPSLIFEPPTDGVFAMRIADIEYGGSSKHFYRITAGPLPKLTEVFPLGVPRGGAAELTVAGVNLGPIGTVRLEAPTGAEPGSIVSVPVTSSDGSQPINSLSVVLADGPQAVESGANDEPTGANPLATPGGVSGRIETPGDVDLFRFEARRGQPLVLELFGRRLSTAIDAAIEILDAQGNPVPRAVLRPVAQTNVAFRDHPSTGRNLRLTVWNELAEGDFLLIGRELTRIAELPRNPDDDAILWGTGVPRFGGERIGLLDTTPEHHPMGQNIYKVEIHPPDATFPPGGIAPVTLFYRNDDGGPGLGKDSRITFDPPADGTYLVRVEDVTGRGGRQFSYHLVARSPRPNFRLSLGAEDLNVPRGGSTVLTVNARRLDGFTGPIDVTLDGLPPGITATTGRIEPEAFAAEIIVSATIDAPALPPAAWKAVARAQLDSVPDGPQELRQELDPGGPSAGWITVIEQPNLVVRPASDRVTIRPGQTVELKLTVERGPAFNGRVPIDVRNLPRGVRVLNIGLNGVLVTEKQVERTITIQADPGVLPQERPFVAVGKCEPAGTEHASKPILLVVEP